MTEEWRLVSGHPNYMVSDQGRVKSLGRYTRTKGEGVRYIPERMLNPPINAAGYRHVILDRKVRNVHRLVAIAFLGEPPFPAAQVNHINNDRSDPRLTNLEWVTPSENQHHSYRTTGRATASKGKFSAQNNASIPVIATNMRTGVETHYEAAMDAVRAGYRSDGISRACAGKIAHHKGHFWRYADGHTGRTWSRGIDIPTPSTASHSGR